MATAALAWGALAGDLSGGLWLWAISIGIPLLVLGALVALPVNLLWAAALTIASRHSIAAVGAVLLLGTIVWFGIGWLYLGRGEDPGAWGAGAWTGIGGLLFGVIHFAGMKPGSMPVSRAIGAR
jgi:hypothetical protein